jgi:hypothetical protein
MSLNWKKAGSCILVLVCLAAVIFTNFPVRAAGNDIAIGNPNTLAQRDPVLMHNTIVPVGCSNWDPNGNHLVSVSDTAYVGSHWGESDSPGWIRADVNCSGTITVSDVSIIGNHFGETW